MIRVLLLCFAVANAALVKRQTPPRQSVADFTMTGYLKLFREALLNKIGTEFNDTIDGQTALQPQITTCNEQLNATIDRCKACVKATCGSSPSFEDYLQLANPYNYLKEPLDLVGNTLGDVFKTVGDGSMSFFNSLEGMAGGVGNTIADGFKDTFNGLVSGLEGIGKKIAGFGSTIGSGVVGGANTVGDGFTDGIGQIGSGLTGVGSQIGSGMENVGNQIKDGLGSAVNEIGSAIGGVFGKKRRRRAIDARTRECMQGCPDCQPLLLPKNDMISSVCGPEILTKQSELKAKAEKAMGVYNDTIDTANPILAKIEYDPTSVKVDQSTNYQVQFLKVYVTVMMNDKVKSYQSKFPYLMSDPTTTIANLAQEYWDTWIL
ncbi:hypothetical protein ScPMuIL_006218 [Solemya velum]